MSDVNNADCPPGVSRVIVASAGAGKTATLVRRYFQLALSLPDLGLGRILTVTFTRKAAAEMRQRIIEEAAVISREAGGDVADDGRVGQNSPAEVAARILRRSQTMRVSTMDSLFNWLARRFALESGLPVGAEIASPGRLAEIFRRSWIGLLNLPSASPFLAEALDLVEGDIDILREFLEKLYRDRRSLLFYRYGGDLESLRRDWRLSEDALYSLDELREDVFGLLRESVKREGWREDRRAELAGLLRSRDLAALVSSSFFKPGKESWPPDHRPAEDFSPNLSLFPRDLREMVKPAGELFKKYRLGLRIRSYNQFLSALLSLYRLYSGIVSKFKAESGLADFTDVALAACRLMRDPGIAYTVQSGVQHLLIDEFQDTSRLQWLFFEPMIEELLSGSGTYSRQSFFAVGDLKQSIYGFRDADYTLLDKLAELASVHPNLRLETLRRSYRAAPLLCAAVNAVFSCRGLPRWEDHETAVERGPGSVTVYPLVGAAVCPRKPDRWREDARRVALSIFRAVADRLLVGEKGPGGRFFQRPCRWGDIAVIYRSGKSSRYLEEALSRLGVPCLREEEGGFYERREVLDVLALLDFLADPSNSAALAAVLRSPLVGLGHDALAGLLAAKKPDRPLWEVLLRRGPPGPVGLLRRALRTVASLPLCRVLEEFLQSAGARFAYASAGDGLAVLNLDRMVDLLGRMSSANLYSIRECREMLKRMSEEDETRMAGGAGDCVRLMTVHKAKGLEFPVVYFFDAAYDAGRPRSPGDFVLLREGCAVPPAAPAPVPDSPAAPPPLVFVPSSGLRPAGHPLYDSWVSRAEEESLEEELRILYVALTRASRHLFISGVEPGKKRALFWDTMVGGLEKLADSDSWRRETEDHCGQPVLLSFRDDTVLPAFSAPPPAAREEVDDGIFSPPPPSGPLLVRPALLAEEGALSGGEGGEENLPPEKHLALGRAVHRALETRARGEVVDPSFLLDGLMEKGHPDRSWVEKELKKDLRVLDSIDFFSRFSSARLLTEVAVLDFVSLPEQEKSIVSGVADLIAVFPGRVELYDYKTNRLRPGREEKTAEKYRFQMEAYLRALGRIFLLPVSGYLLFTATGKIVPVNEDGE